MKTHKTFFDDVRSEVKRAQTLFPSPNMSVIALGEEVGELNKAILDEPWDNVYTEAVQVAAMAYRVCLEGDPSVKQFREDKGLDYVSP